MSLYLKIQHFLGRGQNFLLTVKVFGTENENTVRAHSPGPVLVIMEFCSVDQITWSFAKP